MPVNNPDKLTFAFALSVVNEYGVRYVHASVVYVNEQGELRNPSFRWNEIGADVADFAVTAYTERGNTMPWGFSHHFKPFHLELEQAESAVKVLRKLHKGLEVANAERGWVQDGHFWEYLARIAQVLGIKSYYVRNTDKQRAMSGELFRNTDMSGVQYWVKDRVDELQPANQ